ncbi:MAG: hypothetical protein ACE5JQ_17700, partial [Candidatus Methylomirabilales bacterium]
EILAYSAVLLQLYRLDCRRFREAQCKFHHWVPTSHGRIECTVCQKRVAQSVIGFPNIKIFDRDWPLF